METIRKTNKLLTALKITALGAVGVVSSVAAVGYAERLIEVGNLSDGWGVFGFASIFALVVALEAVLVERTAVLVFLAVVRAVSPLVLLFEKFQLSGTGVLVAGVALFFVFQFMGAAHGKGLMKNSLRIRFLHISNAVIPKAMTGLLLMVSVLFYLSYFQWGMFNDELARKMVGELVESGEPVMRLWYPEADADQTTDEFLNAITEAEVQKLKTRVAREGMVEFDLDLLEPEERRSQIGAITRQAKEELEQRVGSLPGDEKVKDAIFRILQTRASEAELNAPGAGKALGALVALLVFGFLKSMAFFINWLIAGLSLMAYKVLVATGFVEVTFESASKEKITT